MFCQAGFREDYRVIASAMVRRYGRVWQRASHLVCFPDGEYVWGGARGLSWPDQVVVVNYLDAGVFQWKLERSRLPS